MATSKTKESREYSMAAFDISDYLKQTEQWFQQSRDFYIVCNNYAKSFTNPVKWIETIDSMAHTWKMTMRDLVNLYRPSVSDRLAESRAELQRKSESLASLQKELDGLRQQYDQAEKDRKTAALANKELKQTLADKSKSLEENQSVLQNQRTSLEKKEKEISQLQNQIQEQSERIKTLQAEAKKAAQAEKKSKPKPAKPKKEEEKP
jgi:DNA repair exonuclease SbcCD ATPase subunit